VRGETTGAVKGAAQGTQQKKITGAIMGAAQGTQPKKQQEQSWAQLRAHNKIQQEQSWAQLRAHNQKKTGAVRGPTRGAKTSGLMWF